MPEEATSFLKHAQEIGGVFKLGSGVLGKSAIAVGLLIAVGGIAVWRLHSDAAILGAFGLIAVIFLLWFFLVIRFAEKHPDAALLEGSEWTGWQRFQASAKNYQPPSSELTHALPSGSTHLQLPPINPKQSDTENE